MISPAQAFWVGHPGSLVPLWGAKGGLSREADQGVVLQTSMGGGVRARVQRTRASRSWEISIPGAAPGDVDHLEELLTSTLPPYQLVTIEAQVSNVLTPERSTLQDASRDLGLGGWWPVADGRRGHGAIVRLNPSAAFGNLAAVDVGPCPIPPQWTGRSVTASAQLATAREAGARVVVLWQDVTGGLVGTQSNGSLVTGMDGLRRSTVTATPPAGAAACTLAVQWAEVVARPQVTWTDGPVEWSVGQGVDKVVVEKFSSDVVLADEGRGRRANDVSFTATEVGP